MPDLPLPCPPARNPSLQSHCLTVIILDAGQGDATLIVFPDNSLVLVDCGCMKNKNIVKGEIQAVLDAYLQQSGNHLKALVLTHPDADHYNLVNELIVSRGVTIGTLFYGGHYNHYGNLSNWIRNHSNPNYSPRQIGTVVSPGHQYYETEPNEVLSYKENGNAPDVDIRILAANVGDINNTKHANPNSIVLLITYLEFNMFLMGDATIQTEEFITGMDILNGHVSRLLQDKSTFLKAGHHGSATSSGADFIELIKPQVVFISSDTRTFRGVSIPRSGVINTIIERGNLMGSDGSWANHYYVQYNDGTDRHEQVSTTLALYTTLYLLDFSKNNREFVAYGTSWYYTITGVKVNNAFTYDQVLINPSVSWENITDAF